MKFFEFYQSALSEKKMSIQRFSGDNEMSDSELLNFLYKLQSVTQDGNIDLAANDKVSMTEKFDSSKADFGFKDEFFMASSNNVIKSDNIEKYNTPYMSDFYEVFKFLNDYPKFQEKLQKANEYAGTSVKYISEMFPVLTHKGDDIGDIIFVASKYRKDKFGNKGAFMVFDVKILEGESWIDPSDEVRDVLIDIIRDTEDPEWKTYFVEYDGKLSGSIKIDVSGIKDMLSNPEKFNAAIKLLKKRNDDPQKDELKNILNKIRPELQAQLDAYAEKTKSSLGGAEGTYPIEGVVLRVNLPDGPTFIKGTSKIFHDIKNKTWGTRIAINDLEDTLDGQFLVDVLGLSSSNPRTLNTAIKELLPDINKDSSSEEQKNELALKLYKKISSTSNEAEARAKAEKYVDDAGNNLSSIKSQFETSKNSMDPDSIRKSENQIKYFENKLNEIKSRVIDTNYHDEAYFVYLMRLILGRRIESQMNPSEITELNKAIPNSELADITGKPKEYIDKQIATGIDVEHEHTSSDAEAHKIASHHVEELPDYYPKLKAAGLEELDLGDKLRTGFDAITNWLNAEITDEPKPTPPGKNPTHDDLVDTHGGVHATDTGSSDIDGSNLPDQHKDEDEDEDTNSIYNKALGYIQGYHDEDPESWKESYEEFEEDEILDERRFEKVKMARQVLRKIGQNKSFARNAKGKYILRSKDIKKMMADLGYEFNELKGRWIMIPKDEKGDAENAGPKKNPFTAQNVKSTIEPVKEENNKAIIWVGRAQPWHKGHDALIKKSIEQLGEVGANFVMIILVKGAKAGEDVSANPLKLTEQLALLKSVYSNNPQVKVCPEPTTSGFIADVLATAARQHIIVKGWLAGSDRIASYQSQFDVFKTDKYKKEFIDKAGSDAPYPFDGDIKFIGIGRNEEPKVGRLTKQEKEAKAAEKEAKNKELASKASASDKPTIPVEQMSGTLARKLVNILDFKHWVKEVAPVDKLQDKTALQGYQMTYGALKAALTEVVSLQENLKKKLTNIFFGE